MESPANVNHYCSFCSFKSIYPSKLEAHLRNHTQEKPFFCHKCKQEFTTNNGLKVHMRTSVHRGLPALVQEKTHKCSLCPFATHLKSCLEDHTRRHTGERSYPCQHPTCAYAAKSSSDLHAHNIRIHVNKRKFKCPFPGCGYRAKQKSDMRLHSVTHSECRPFICDFQGCNHRTKTRANMQNHERSVHHGGHKPFACSLCSYRTTFRSTLKEHQLTHQQEKSFKCNYKGCAGSFKTEKYLKAHLLRRHTEKTFKCDFDGCSSAMASQRLLEIHKKYTHYGYYEKILKCPSCDFRAAHPSRLRRHVEELHIRRRFPCPNKGCTFDTTRQESLKQHMEHHEANLGCPVEGCGYVGRSIKATKRHMQFHDPTGRPFPCSFCLKRFSKKARLSAHLRIHTSEKQFKCPVCSYGSVHKSGLIDHVRIVHSNVFPEFRYDKKSTCSHCHVNFGSATDLAMHTVKLKTAVVVLTKLQVKLDI